MCIVCWVGTHTLKYLPYAIVDRSMHWMEQWIIHSFIFHSHHFSTMECKHQFNLWSNILSFLNTLAIISPRGYFLLWFRKVWGLNDVRIKTSWRGGSRKSGRLIRLAGISGKKEEEEDDPATSLADDVGFRHVTQFKDDTRPNQRQLSTHFHSLRYLLTMDFISI